MMSVPNEDGQNVSGYGSASLVYTSVAPSGTPPPASEAGNYIQAFDPWASKTVQGDTPDLATAITPGNLGPTEQYSAEYCLPSNVSGNAGGTPLFITSNVSSGASEPGLPPTPSPTFKAANGGSSDGQQPGSNTLFG